MIYVCHWILKYAITKKKKEKRKNWKQQYNSFSVSDFKIKQKQKSLCQKGFTQGCELLFLARDMYYLKAQIALKNRKISM